MDTFGQRVRRTLSSSYMDTRQKLRRSLSIDYKLVFWYLDGRSFIIGAGAVSVLFLAIVQFGKLDLRLKTHPNAWMMSSSLFIIALTGLATRKPNSENDHEYNNGDYYYYHDIDPRSSIPSMLASFQEDLQLHDMISSSPTPAPPPPPPPPPPSPPPSAPPLMLEQVSEEIIVYEPSIEDTWNDIIEDRGGSTSYMREITAAETWQPPSAPLLEEADLLDIDEDDEEIDGPSIEDTWKAIMMDGERKKDATWERYHRCVEETRALVGPLPPLPQPKEPEKSLEREGKKKEKKEKKKETGWRNLTKVLVDKHELFDRAEMLIKNHYDNLQFQNKTSEKQRRRQLQSAPSRAIIASSQY